MTRWSSATIVYSRRSVPSASSVVLPYSNERRYSRGSNSTACPAYTGSSTSPVVRTTAPVCVTKTRSPPEADAPGDGSAAAATAAAATAAMPAAAIAACLRLSPMAGAGRGAVLKLAWAKFVVQG